jgi:hypothetical protein
MSLRRVALDTPGRLAILETSFYRSDLGIDLPDRAVAGSSKPSTAEELRVGGCLVQPCTTPLRRLAMCVALRHRTRKWSVSLR